MGAVALSSLPNVIDQSIFNTLVGENATQRELFNLYKQSDGTISREAIIFLAKSFDFFIIHDNMNQLLSNDCHASVCQMKTFLESCGLQSAPLIRDIKQTTHNMYNQCSRTDGNVKSLLHIDNMPAADDHSTELTDIEMIDRARSIIVLISKSLIQACQSENSSECHYYEMFMYSLKKKGFQSVIPVVFDSSLSDPSTWGLLTQILNTNNIVSLSHPSLFESGMKKLFSLILQTRSANKAIASKESINNVNPPQMRPPSNSIKMRSFVNPRITHSTLTPSLYKTSLQFYDFVNRMIPKATENRKIILSVVLERNSIQSANSLSDHIKASPYYLASIGFIESEIDQTISYLIGLRLLPQSVDVSYETGESTPRFNYQSINYFLHKCLDQGNKPAVIVKSANMILKYCATLDVTKISESNSINDCHRIHRAIAIGVMKIINQHYGTVDVIVIALEIVSHLLKFQDYCVKSNQSSNIDIPHLLCAEYHLCSILSRLMITYKKTSEDVILLSLNIIIELSKIKVIKGVASSSNSVGGNNGLVLPSNQNVITNTEKENSSSQPLPVLQAVPPPKIHPVIVSHRRKVVAKLSQAIAVDINKSIVPMQPVYFSKYQVMLSESNACQAISAVLQHFSSNMTIIAKALEATCGLVYHNIETGLKFLMCGIHEIIVNSLRNAMLLSLDQTEMFVQVMTHGFRSISLLSRDNVESRKLFGDLGACEIICSSTKLATDWIFSNQSSLSETLRVDILVKYMCEAVTSLTKLYTVNWKRFIEASVCGVLTRIVLIYHSDNELMKSIALCIISVAGTHHIHSDGNCKLCSIDFIFSNILKNGNIACAEEVKLAQKCLVDVSNFPSVCVRSSN